MGRRGRRPGSNTLQSKVSQLRRALGRPGLVTSGNGGYALARRPSPASTRCTSSTWPRRRPTARRAGDAAAAVDVAAEGLALFRGDVLVDAGDGDWLHAHRARLEEVRLGLVEDQLAARVALGAGGDVIGELEGLVEQYPLREGLWSSLITALYRAGRQADALAAYTRVRDAARRRARRRTRARTCAPSKARSCSRAPHSAARPTGRPRDRLGRQPARALLAARRPGRRARRLRSARCATDRLVTLVGPAGVGKTRPAIEVARQLDAARRASGWCGSTRSDAADVDPPDRRRDAAPRRRRADARRPLRRRRDRARCSTTASTSSTPWPTWSAGCWTPPPDCGAGHQPAAARARRRGRAIALEPLPLADSVALFAGRAARAARTQFVLDEETAAVVEEVCRSLDGLPLAIELAAARVKSLSVQEIARRLDDRFALLRDPTSRRPERRRALAAAIGWSYDLLFPDDQRGLWALSCFAGGAPLAAAEHVLGALGVPAAAVPSTSSAGWSTGRWSASTIDGDGAVRYRLLDSIRAFARDAAAARPGSATTRRAAHAAWFAEAADRCARDRARRRRSPRAWPSCAPSGPTSTPPWRGRAAARPAPRRPHRERVRLDVGGARRRRRRRRAGPRRRSPRPPVSPRRRSGPRRCCSPAGSRHPPATSSGRSSDLDGALGLAGAARRRPRCAPTPTGTWRSCASSRAARTTCSPMAAASLAGYRRSGCTGSRPRACSSRRTARSCSATPAAPPRRRTRRSRLLTPIGDSWGLVHAEAMLGAIAQAEHRFDDAATSLSSAAAASERLGFLGQAALHLTTPRPGRATSRATERRPSTR